MSENVGSLYRMKIKPVAIILIKFIKAMIAQHFRKRNNKLINQCDIKLFRIVLGNIKVPMIISSRDLLFWTIYIDRYQIRGWAHGLLTFIVYC